MSRILCCAGKWAGAAISNLSTKWVCKEFSQTIAQLRPPNAPVEAPKNEATETNNHKTPSVIAMNFTLPPIPLKLFGKSQVLAVIFVKSIICTSPSGKTHIANPSSSHVMTPVNRRSPRPQKAVTAGGMLWIKEVEAHMATIPSESHNVKCPKLSKVANGNFHGNKSSQSAIF